MSVAPLQTAIGIAAFVLALAAGPALGQAFQTTLQISPQGGGRCADVPNREFVKDRGLQIWDCNGSPGQLFTYDPGKQHLSIGGLCVDANGGGPGDLVKLSACDDNAGLVWKAEQKGTFTKLIGVKGLCFDIRYGAKDNGSQLQSWACGDAEPNQLWSLQRR
jgi:hypothetical protein